MPQASQSSDIAVTIDHRRQDRCGQSQIDGASATEFKPAGRRTERRRQIDPTTCERDYNTDEIDFMQAMEAYKRSSGRMFPTCSEILEVLRDMGYVRLNSEEMHLLPSIDAVEAELAHSTD